ncbi:MAG: Nif3-like dinuclear metal center hexameric protein [Ruminococcaceae bacterium]|nr:Nif3-like dinuclear metal center hexameric protein [Oscillospiraceae bacterium]
MTTVQNILDFMETVAPSYMKYNWDHIGLNCGHSDAPVTKILIALDPFAEAVAEAKELGAQLLVTHHALIWEGGFVNDKTPWGKCTLELIESGIAHINAHTNLDCAPGGINDVLAETLGLSDISVVNPMGTDAQGAPYGLLRIGKVAPQGMDAFLATVKEKLHCQGLRYVNSTNTVHRVAVGGGSCASDMMDAYQAGCDTFVTADIKYNQFRAAYDLGINLIDAGHFHTENPTMPVLAEKIRKAFPEIQVVLSEKHGDCMKFY